MLSGIREASGNRLFFFGVQCCYDGQWSCADPSGNYPCGGTTTRGPFSTQCPLPPFCCDPLKEPSHFGNPICFEGHACCPQTGEWLCNNGGGQSSCSGGVACTGSSLIDAGSHVDSVATDSEAQSATLLEKGVVTGGVSETPIVSVDPNIIILPRIKCCPFMDEPGKYGNAPCLNNGVTKCCTNGQWSCGLSDGTVICNGIYTCGPLSGACEVPPIILLDSGSDTREKRSLRGH